MSVAKRLAIFVILLSNGWRRLMMLLRRPAFRSCGRHVLFDPRDHFNYENIELGDDVSVGSGAVFLASDSKIIVGTKVMFGPNVTIIGGDHNTAVVGKFMYDVHEKRPQDDRDVVIADDVWVSAGAIILRGVHVGRGAVIAAGALVNRDVPPYSVVGGVPARVLTMRFNCPQKIIEHEKELYPEDGRLSLPDVEGYYST